MSFRDPSRSTLFRESRELVNWELMLDPFLSGGPGESPGRPEVVRLCIAAQLDKKRLREIQREERREKRGRKRK